VRIARFEIRIHGQIHGIYDLFEMSQHHIPRNGPGGVGQAA